MNQTLYVTMVWNSKSTVPMLWCLWSLIFCLNGSCMTVMWPIVRCWSFFWVYIGMKIGIRCFFNIKVWWSSTLLNQCTQERRTTLSNITGTQCSIAGKPLCKIRLYLRALYWMELIQQTLGEINQVNHNRLLQLAPASLHTAPYLTIKGRISP